MRRKELFRIKSQSRVAGVCAGLAEYFGIETWLVRIITVTSFLLLAPPFVFVGYIALWFILEDKSASKGKATSSHDTAYHEGEASSAANSRHEVDANGKVSVKAKIWQAGVPPRQALINIKDRYNSVENKLRKLESYVTSKEFQLNREINRL
jgi:phage shock protein C